MKTRTMAAALAALMCLAVRIPAQVPVDAPTFHGVDTADMDTSVKPCVDFWEFANGRWLAQNPIPADEPAWGVNDQIDEHNFAILHAILDQAAAHADATPDSIEGKVGRFYRLGMDTAKIEADGAKPLAPELARIAAVKDAPGLQDEIARLHRRGIDVGFSFYAGQDDKDSTRVIGQMDQAGLGLPDRDYYFDTDAKSKTIRSAYVTHVSKMLRLLGDAPAKADAEARTVMALETRLAKASMTRVQQRDPNAVYHRMTLAQVDRLTPGVIWDRYFSDIGLPHPGDLNVAQPVFVAQVGTMIHTVPIADWQVYFRWHLVHSTAPDLSEAFVDENFAFQNTTLQGVTVQRPRWKRVLTTTDSEIGEALGQLYVAKAFPPDAKARALTMVNNIKAALRDDITTLPWMSGPTRAQALHKLDTLHVKIGYPDKWRDYTALKLDAGTYVGNVMQADEFEFQRNLNKIGKPVDRSEWGMTPPTNNAYYDPQMNEIVFPAGILQPPFFDAEADDASNYGEIGATIGHEMTHGFDDEGRQYDAEGNLKDWWTPADAKNFAVRTQAIVAQYNQFCPLDGRHINGELTLGENIADIGGLKLAYLALEKSLQGKPRPPLIEGYTAEQRFFIAYAQSWSANIRPELIRERLTTDPHSTDKFRVLGPLADMPEFYQAFGCPTPPMSPASLW
jgi:putative endopeptidase